MPLVLSARTHDSIVNVANAGAEFLESALNDILGVLATRSDDQGGRPQRRRRTAKPRATSSPSETQQAQGRAVARELGLEGK
jgi:hypothetical protein